MNRPEAPPERFALRLRRAAQARGPAAAGWAGRGDEERCLSILALGTDASAFARIFLSRLGFGGHSQSRSNLPVGFDYGLLVLAIVLVQLLSLTRAWISRDFEVLTFCLVAAAGVVGSAVLANVRWGVS